MNTSTNLWISHSAINDFLRCPKLYYLHNVYRNPQTRNKISIVSPSLALGLSVHEVLESLVKVRAEERKYVPLLKKFEEVWKSISGEKGGFRTQDEENIYKERGIGMLQRVAQNPGPLYNKAVRLLSPDSLPPRYLLSVKDNVFLCGKVDWMEYFPEDNSVHIIDFKTGKYEENPESLQLAIYCLLVKHCQTRKIRKVSYWYLDQESSLVEMLLPDCELATKRLLDIALAIKRAKVLNEFACTKGSCFACKPFLAVVNGDAKLVGQNDYQDIYMINKL